MSRMRKDGSPRQPLTEIEIDDRVIRREVKKADAGRVLRLRGLKGFMVVCNRRSASYVLQRKLRGRNRRVTIGLVGEKTAQQALREALEALEMFHRGLNPTEERRRSDIEGMTLEEAFSLLVKTKTQRGDWSPKTLELNREIYDRYLSKWSDRTIQQIGEDRAAVNALHTSIQQAVAKRSKDDGAGTKQAPAGWATANNVLRLLSNVYTRARREVPSLPPNPAFGQRHGGNVDFFSGKTRDSSLSTDELREWYERVQRLSNPAKRTYWLAVLLTGGRREQVAESRWDGIDLETEKTWHFPKPKGGSARRYTIPVSDFLAERLRELHEYTDTVHPKNPYVFPSDRSEVGHMTKPRNDKQGLPRAHALRHTYRTHGFIAGVPREMMWLLMNHKPPAQERVSFGYITREVTMETLRDAQEKITAHFLRYFGISNVESTKT